MTMPRGHKIVGGYATVSQIQDACDYKLIAKRCSDSGDKMSHSTARNIFLTAMAKVADNLHRSHGNICTRQQLFKIAKNPIFQMSVAEILKGDE
jgi:hypothetical protein